MPRKTDAIPPVPPSTIGPMLIAVLNDRLRKIQALISQSGGASGVLLFGSHLKRVASPAPQNAGKIFVETDRGYIQYVSDGNNWHFVSGMYSGAWIQRPSDLGPFDAGLQFFVSVQTAGFPFNGFIEMWSGTGWLYVSGEAQMGYGEIVLFGALLTSSEVGLIVADSDFLHRYQWQGGGFLYAAGDCSQFFVQGDMMPSGGVWFPCDGGSHICSQTTGIGTRLVPTQNLNNGTIVAAIMSGGFLQAVIPATSMSFTGVGGGMVLASGGALKPVAPSVADGGLPQYYTGSWWLRA